MNEVSKCIKKDLDDLDKRFNKKNRDVGKLQLKKLKSLKE